MEDEEGEWSVPFQPDLSFKGDSERKEAKRSFLSLYLA
jgi:hypothetical protein